MEDLERLNVIFESLHAGNSLKDFYLSDPIWFPKRFRKKNDIETAALIAALFAIGPRYAIIRSLEKIFAELGESPYETVADLDHAGMLRKMDGHIQFAYKNITGKDVIQILSAIRHLIGSHGTIQNALKLNARSDDGSTYYMLTGVLEEMKKCKLPSSLGGELTPRARALLASPAQGSACKRMNMFLRWMTRSDEIDFGLYDWLGTEKLVIPLDVNVSRAARQLKLTRRKTDNWKTAVEITQRLKELDPLDPVKFDVPLFLYGIELRKKRRAT
ncbi:MAG: TIGR02757 family protein [Bacteroidetes bacterium]|nr:TIGR02757 family protein [Bacteroidota bacterium]